MKFAFIREKKVAFPVATLCRVLGVSSSGFYDWQKAPDSTRKKQDAVLAAKIAQTHERSRGRYGSPRVHADLRAGGLRVSRKVTHQRRRDDGRDRASQAARLEVRWNDERFAMSPTPGQVLRR